MKQIVMNTDINEINTNETNTLAKMDLNLLKVFMVLCQEENVTKAAKRLCVTQAAISASLKRLRAYYNDPLFERTQSGMKPTTQALLIRPIIQEALSRIGDSINNYKEQDLGSESRTIVIGLSDDYEIAFGKQLIEEIRNEIHNHRVIFRQTNSEKVVAALTDRQIDLAITGGGVHGARLRRESLGSAGYLCVYDGSRREEKFPLTLEEFITREHILISFSGVTGAVDDALSEKKLTRKIKAASTHFAALPFLLQGTDAIATIPCFAANAICRDSVLSTSKCPVKLPKFPIELGWEQGTPKDKTIIQARDIIARVIGQRG